MKKDVVEKAINQLMGEPEPIKYTKHITIKEKENGKKLKELRVKHNLTRKKACEYFAIPLNTWFQWEHGDAKMKDWTFDLIKFRFDHDNTLKKI